MYPHRRGPDKKEKGLIEMKYCQFCGTQLEDGEQCTCPDAQEARVAEAQQRARTQKPVLTQEQKEEMQKTMAEAKASAKAAGKALLGTAKAYGSSFAESAQNGLAKGGAAQAGAAMYRKIMMAFGALQVLFFFILSYAKLDGSGSLVKTIASYIGIDVPRRLTGFTAVRLMNACAEYGIPNADEAFMELLIVFGVPVLCGVLLIVFNLKGKPGGGMLSSIILSALTLVCYFIARTDLSGAVEKLGYEMGLGFGFVLLVSALQTAAAVLGHIASKKAKSAA